MKWILLPQDVVNSFLNNQSLIPVFSSIIFEDLPSSFEVKVEGKILLTGEITDISEDIRLMSIWLNNLNSPVVIKSGMVSIWCDSEGFNISLL